MRASKAAISFVQNASETRLKELQELIVKEKQRRRLFKFSESGAKIGIVVRAVYLTFMRFKLKLKKDANGALFCKGNYPRAVKTKNGYKFTPYYAVKRSMGDEYSFIMDYANKKKIKLKTAKE